MNHHNKNCKIFYIINEFISNQSALQQWVDYNDKKGFSLVIYDPYQKVSFIKESSQITYYNKQNDLQKEFQSTTGSSFLFYNSHPLNIPFHFVNSFQDPNPFLVLGYKLTSHHLKNQKQYFIEKDYKLTIQSTESSPHAHYYNTNVLRVPDQYLKNESIATLTQFDKIYQQIETKSDIFGFPVGIPEKFDLTPKKALFLDRDGIINIDKKYLKNPDEVELVPGICELIKAARADDRLILVVTNQSGIARNYYQIEDMKKVHNRISDILREQDLHIDKFYYSPYLDEDNGNTYSEFSLLRKPYPGMILLALNDYNIDIKQSYMVGDKTSDIIQYPYLKTLLLKGDYSFDNISSNTEVFENLNQIARYI